MTAWLTALVAIVVAMIAFLRWVTARQKIVLDLFDKRFAVYEELRGVIGRHVTQGAVSIEDLGKFTSAASRAQFLFGPEVCDFLEERRLDLSRAIHEFISRPLPIPPERQKEAEERMVARLDRLADFFKDLDVLVQPYMKHTQKSFRIPYIDI